MTRWAILTGEYPPQPGGVADYTHLVAAGLADAGDTVTVYAPRASGPSAVYPGIIIRRLPDQFGPRSLLFLNSALTAHPRPERILIQYVPHMYGWKAMNVLFCVWLWLRRRSHPWVMFHEVTFPIHRKQRFRHNVLGTMNRLMAALVIRASAKIFVSTQWWEPLVRRLGAIRKPITWLPIPSNMPTCADSTRVATVRTNLSISPEVPLVGHFGTFGSLIGNVLAAALPILLREETKRHGIMVGRGSVNFVERLIEAYPDLAGRLHACGEMEPKDVVAHLQACDLLLQPFPDGVSGRRTSLMAGLALGLPIVTTAGNATEVIWSQEQLVALAPATEPATLVAEAEKLLDNPKARAALGQRARAGYLRFFDLEHTLRVLRG